jgi:hypothetical protein
MHADVYIVPTSLHFRNIFPYDFYVYLGFIFFAFFCILDRFLLLNGSSFLWLCSLFPCQALCSFVHFAQLPCTALQKYMHELHADRDHAMYNIYNRSIPVVQLTQLQKLSIKNF